MIVVCALQGSGKSTCQEYISSKGVSCIDVVDFLKKYNLFRKPNIDFNLVTSEIFKINPDVIFCGVDIGEWIHQNFNHFLFITITCSIEDRFKRLASRKQKTVEWVRSTYHDEFITGEQKIAKIKIASTINNNSTIDDFYHEIDAVFKNLYKKQ